MTRIMISSFLFSLFPLRVVRTISYDTLSKPIIYHMILLDSFFIYIYRERDIYTYIWPCMISGSSLFLSLTLLSPLIVLATRDPHNACDGRRRRRLQATSQAGHGRLCRRPLLATCGWLALWQLLIIIVDISSYHHISSYIDFGLDKFESISIYLYVWCIWMYR